MKRFCTLKGTSGSLLSEEDFIVEEIPDRRFLRRYEKSAGKVREISGPYILFKLTKKGMTTEDAIKHIAKEWGLKAKDIGFAGLKDKFAVTSQYITAKKGHGNLCSENLSVEKAGESSRQLSVGGLEGNRFAITLHNCRSAGNLKKIISFLEKNGMPNYFGQQRFGRHGDNHAIGRFLVLGKHDKAAAMIKSHGRASDIRSAEKRRLKFYVNAYQSWIFNRMLEVYLKENKKPIFKNAPIIGTQLKARNDTFGKILTAILEREKISEKDFCINELRISCSGGWRPAFVRPKIENAEASGNNISLKFTLPKGSYATVLLNEITGNNALIAAKSW